MKTGKEKKLTSDGSGKGNSRKKLCGVTGLNQQTEGFQGFLRDVLPSGKALFGIFDDTLEIPHPGVDDEGSCERFRQIRLKTKRGGGYQEGGTGPLGFQCGQGSAFHVGFLQGEDACGGRQSCLADDLAGEDDVFPGVGSLVFQKDGTGRDSFCFCCSCKNFRFGQFPSLSEASGSAGEDDKGG